MAVGVNPGSSARNLDFGSDPRVSTDTTVSTYCDVVNGAPNVESERARHNEEGAAGTEIEPFASELSRSEYELRVTSNQTDPVSPVESRLTPSLLGAVSYRFGFPATHQQHDSGARLRLCVCARDRC